MTPWRQSADAFAADLQRIFADRLRSVVAYGPHLDGDHDAPLTCLALVASLGITDLQGCARLLPRWERQGLATPLILPVDEFRRSLDAFPLEYGEILRSHAPIFGTNPFDGLSIAAGDLRRACEVQVKSHLIHLREGFIETGDEPQAIAELVTMSAPAFTALLRQVAQLGGHRFTAPDEAALQGGRAAGLDERVIGELAALHRTVPSAPTDPARLFPEYLAAVEQLARAVDAWRT